MASTAGQIATNSYHPNGNGGVERVNHTMAQMLAMVVNELQNNRDVQLPHVELAYNNSVSAVTGLAPNELHMGRFPRLPFTSFERTGVFGHQSLARDHLSYCDLATGRQQRAYDIVREHHVLTVSRVKRRNSALFDALHAVLKFCYGLSLVTPWQMGEAVPLDASRDDWHRERSNDQKQKNCLVW